MLLAADYYWVGGSGNWSDIAHWATTSGGTTKHNKTPTSADNVFFNANSFTGPGQTVTVNTDIIFCRNMNWTGATGNPQLVATANRTLNVYGSLILTANMDFNFAGSIRMLTQEAGQVIDGFGHVLGNSLLLEGNGGEWTLQSPLAVDSVINLRNGALISNDQSITAGYLDVQIRGTGTLNLGGSKVILKGNTDTSQNKNIRPLIIDKTNLTIVAMDAEVELTGETASVSFIGAGAISMGNLLFSADSGKSILTIQPSVDVQLRRLAFDNSATVTGKFTTQRLTLAAGKAYTFEGGLIYNIERLDAPGECEAPIQIFGSISGTPATFNSTAGPIQVTYASIKDIAATGGANFTADNSAALGNTSGWTINMTAQQNLYWVGGTGDWDDPNHWSFTSGGPGGACVPTGADNVFFDGNSFVGNGNTVTINVENALCKNMNWTGADGRPVFTGPMENNLRIYGSLRMINNMELAFEGDVYFESSATGNTVQTGNHQFLHNVYFNGNGGAWSLNDSLKVTSYIELVSGFLTTNNQTVICERFLSQSFFPRQLLLGNSQIILRQFDLTMGGVRTCQFWLQSENLIFDAGSSLIDFIQYGQLRTDGSGAVNYYQVRFAWFSSVRNEPSATVYIHELTFLSEGQLFDGFTAGTLTLTPNFEYQFESDRTFTVNNLIAPGTCDALIYMHSTEDNQESFIAGANNLTGDYLILQDLYNTSGRTFTATNSVDAGNNQNWQIDQRAPRTLYWVGGTGFWSDMAHWSLSSGGPGGECIPTPIDDVIFDENSFNQGNQQVGDEYPYHYCHNITWRNITRNPGFVLPDLLVFGSLEFIDDMMVSISNTRFSGDEPGHTINTRGHYLNYTYFQGAGDWTLLDDFNGNWVGMNHGGWNTNGFAVELEYFNSYGDVNPKQLQLGDSYLLIHGSKPSNAWTASGNITVDAGNSTIELTSNTATFFNRKINGGVLDYNRVLFTANDGQSAVEANDPTSLTFDFLQFDNNGVVYGSHTYDTLIFAPGKAYQLQANGTQTIVDHWQIIGNNCVPIQLSSTQPGVQSTAFMAGGEVNGDFIQMQDQAATGGGTFYAGIHSTNVGMSNTGWIFENSEDFIEVGFLGEDVILCNNNSVVLDADNKSLTETYLWQDGSTGAQFTAAAAGVYWAEVSFANNCTIRDSIQVIPPDAFVIDLGNDTTLCTGNNLSLDATFNALGVRYLWQDDSKEPTFLVDAPGQYKVGLTLGGCTIQDSLEVAYFDPPELNVAPDQTLCFATTLDLDANIAEAVAYNWQDGSTGPVFTVSGPGDYWVDVDFEHCIQRDSVRIDYHPEIFVDLGADTTLCEQETFLLDAVQNGATYLWQDGSTAGTKTVATPGIYWVDVIINGCSQRDSLEATFTPLPVFDLGADLLRPCEGEMPTLSANLPGAAYSWQDGSSQADFQISNNGIYWLDVTVDGCTERDSVTVDYVLLPKMVLGEDQILCDGEVLRYDVSFPGATYRWQDGSDVPVYNITTTGTYSVDVSMGQCVERDEVSIAFNPTPTFSLRSDTLLCQGETLALNVRALADEIVWSDGSTAAGLTATYPGGLYWAEARLDNCAFRDSVFIDYQEPPLLDLGPDTLICEDFSISLSAGVAADSYLWHDGSTMSSIQTSTPGLYALQVTDGPCVVLDSVFIGTRPCLYFDVYLPNAFSPNGDGINDDLRPMLPIGVQITSYTFKVYDRWGTEVFKTNSLEAGWDGQFQSLPMAMGIYVYYVQFDYTDDRGGGSELLTGDVMLMK
jgi:gliding motility-associated-like protein